MNKPLNFNETYSSTLVQHKERIKASIYAKELEKRYHKVNHKPYKQDKYFKHKVKEPDPLWPVESTTFTKVLRSKLSSLFTPTTLKSQQSKQFFQQIKEKSLRVSSEIPSLPKINKNRYWSPPNLKNIKIKFFGPTERRLIAPKIKPILII